MPADVMQYTEGTLILDFVDRRTHKLVFRGVGQGVVSTSREKNTSCDSGRCEQDRGAVSGRFLEM